MDDIITNKERLYKGGVIMDNAIQCPECGKMFDSTKSESLDNGNPICPDCADKQLYLSADELI